MGDGRRQSNLSVLLTKCECSPHLVSLSHHVSLPTSHVLPHHVMRAHRLTIAANSLPQCTHDDKALLSEKRDRFIELMMVSLDSSFSLEPPEQCNDLLREMSEIFNEIQQRPIENEVMQDENEIKSDEAHKKIELNSEQANRMTNHSNSKIKDLKRSERNAPMPVLTHVTTPFKSHEMGKGKRSMRQAAADQTTRRETHLQHSVTDSTQREEINEVTPDTLASSQQPLHLPLSTDHSTTSPHSTYYSIMLPTSQDDVVTPLAEVLITQTSPNTSNLLSPNSPHSLQSPQSHSHNLRPKRRLSASGLSRTLELLSSPLDEYEETATDDDLPHHLRPAVGARRAVRSPWSGGNRKRRRGAKEDDSVEDGDDKKVNGHGEREEGPTKKSRRIGAVLSLTLFSGLSDSQSLFSHHSFLSPHSLFSFHLTQMT
eukprot:GHVN01041758.1.p1 GENE.GHVN01041758.1~~GHVN01041758.1.p1  ORF type:complete len:428 (-),score=147.75 GHVN01041758.1:859-2142(-)